MDKDLQDTRSRTETSSHCFVRSTAPSTDTSAIIRHILASRSAQPNAFGAKIPVPTALKVHMWAHLLRHYDDKIVAEFLKYGWPINYSSINRHYLHLTIINRLWPLPITFAITSKQNCPLGPLLALSRSTRSASLSYAPHFRLSRNAVRLHAESSWT